MRVKHRLYQRLQCEIAVNLGGTANIPLSSQGFSNASSLGKEGVICFIPAGDEEKADNGAYAQRAEETLKPLP